MTTVDDVLRSTSLREVLPRLSWTAGRMAYFKTAYVCILVLLYAALKRILGWYDTSKPTPPLSDALWSIFIFWLELALLDLTYLTHRWWTIATPSETKEKK